MLLCPCPLPTSLTARRRCPFNQILRAIGRREIRALHTSVSSLKAQHPSESAIFNARISEVQGLGEDPPPAPESFYGGVLGKIRSMRDVGYRNEAGLPSTGREEALIGVAAAKEFAAGNKSVVPSRHIFNELSLVRPVVLQLLLS